MSERQTSLIYPGVVADSSTRIDHPCVIGKPGASAKGAETVFGSGCVLRPFTTIYAGVRVGDRVQTGQGATIREGNIIGDDVSIGTNAVLEPGNVIGDRVRIHSGCFMELVTIGNDVFIGPNVVFADDPHPPCPNYERCVGGATVGDRTSIGANSTILPGVRIGSDVLIGAGSVVTEDVPDGSVAVGNPARVIKRVDELVCRSAAYPRPYAWREESVR